MMTHTDTLAERLNAEANIFKGCTGFELITIATVSFFFWLPILMMTFWVIGSALFGMGCSVLATVITTVILATLLQRVKRNRPNGYYQQRLSLMLSHYELMQSPFIQHTGVWSTTRE